MDVLGRKGDGASNYTLAFLQAWIKMGCINLRWLGIPSLHRGDCNSRIHSLFRSRDAYWSVAGQRVERVKVGEPVTAHVLLRSQDRFDGDFIIRVRVDRVFRFDKDIATQRLYVVLRPGVDEEFKLNFRPPLASA